MNSNQTMIKMVFDRWYALIKQADTLFSSLTDEQLQNEIAPGKNRGIYLLGHLIAVHDSMIPLLDLVDKIYLELFEPFIASPDKAVADLPSAAELRAFWSKHNELLAQKFDSVQPDEWFQKHTAVSAEEFIVEPHRNKLNIILTRASHLSYHMGQLVLLK